MTNKRVLLTGGAGFIGSQIAKRLVDDNEIVIYDNMHRNALRYTELSEHRNVTVITGETVCVTAFLAVKE